jgi:hypothetical protein
MVVKSAALYRCEVEKGRVWFTLQKALLYDGPPFGMEE